MVKLAARWLVLFDLSTKRSSLGDTLSDYSCHAHVNKHTQNVYSFSRFSITFNNRFNNSLCILRNLYYLYLAIQ